MAHFCGFIKLIFLLLMLQQMLGNSETRPLESRTVSVSSDLIAGNEFLKLFMDREELENDYYSKRSGGGGSAAISHITKDESVTETFNDSQEFDKKSAETGKSRQQASRSLKAKTAKLNQAEGQLENSKQLNTNAGKLLYNDDDYEENDAILDAEARDIDLKRERFKNKNDDFRVITLAPTVSHRGIQNRYATTTSGYDNKSYTSNKSMVTMTPRPPAVTSTNKPATTTPNNVVASVAGDSFINRSQHKSGEVDISNVREQQQQQQQQRQQHRKVQQPTYKSRKLITRQRTYPITSVADTLEALDSENSASTNIQNVLASPLQSAPSLRSMSTVTTTYQSGQQKNLSINHDTSSAQHQATDTDTNDKDPTVPVAGAVDDQLLPFQTVIYHDTKDGHPQSRSISYSSISQNVEDLKKWHQTGILAEARRNVSESLKLSHSHQSEPAKFYSQPSKMYSEPSKFYSEPSKVYSEPAKVYGEPEKVYSEPAKVYGEPSKFYSEPSKVYSQPAKVYSEPAQTYWPVGLTTSSTTIRPDTFNPTTQSSIITTTATQPLAYPNSRKPAIVSRIAFGEAASTSSTTSTTVATAKSTTAAAILTTTTSKPFSSYQHRTYGHQTNTASSSSSSSSSSFSSSADRIQDNTSSVTPSSRRILFNLDRLPYDLLNAPQPQTAAQQQQQHQQQQQQQQTFTYQQQQQQQQQRHHNINPCLESAVSSLFSSSTLSAHPAIVKQRQQHSSLSDQQHSNQNAKGLPNGDLVRCVAGIPATITNDGTVDDSVPGIGAAGLQFTTERNSNVDDLYTPTPEQNYEIEESVSVMTNGRAHGVQGGSGRNGLQLATTTLIPPLLNAQVFKPNAQRIHFGTNIDVDGDDVGGGGHLSHSTSYNRNAANANRNLGEGGSGTDYAGDYDDGDGGGGGGGGGDDGGDGNDDDYSEDGNAGHHRGGSGGDEEDDKVAYVVEGRNFRKYRVEKKTDSGFIVGEYGVVTHNDGNLRGVRYTADSTINRSLIQKALLTFLKLK